MKAVFSVVVSDGKSTIGSGWIDEEYPDNLTNEQHKAILDEVLINTFTKEMAEEGKSVYITLRKAGKIDRLSYSFMSASQRLARQD